MKHNTSESTPIFIGGLYKSGTSLLRAMLSQHSNIAGGLETFWFDLDFAGKASLNQNSRNWDATRNEPLEDHLDRLAAFFDMDRNKVQSIVEKSSRAEEFIDSFMGEYALLSGKNRWVEKTPANILHIERIFNFWPKGHFIHIVRDPRDVYSSIRQTGKWREPEVFARLWIKFIGAYETANKLAPAESIMEMQYEKLVTEPEKTMRDVLEFVKEPWETNVAIFQGEPQDYVKVKKLTGKTSTTLEKLGKPLFNNRIGAWNKELDDAEALSKLENIIRENGFGKVWDSYKWS